MNKAYLRYINISLIFVFFSFTALAQSTDSSFNKQINNASSTEQKIDLFLDYSKKISYSNPNRSHELAKTALEMALEAQYEKGKAEAYMRIGVYYIYHNDYAKALDNIFKAEKIATQLDEKELMAKCLMNLGNVYYDTKDRDKAIEYFDKALKIAKEIDDKDDIAGCLTNFGNVYSDNGDFKLAVDNFQKALKMYTQINDMQGVAKSLFNIGNVYFYQENYKMALNYYQKSLKVERAEDDKLDIIIALNAIGKVYMKMNRDDEALDFCTQSLDLAWEIHSDGDISNACYSLASIYKKRKDYKNSLAYYTMATNLRESLYNDEKNKEFGKLEAKHMSEKQESEIAMLKKDKSLKEEQAHKELLMKNITIAVLLMFSLVVVSVILYTKNRKEHQINQKLIARNKEIAAQAEALKILNEELDQFVYRSSHDLKAPLTSVLGLITIIQIDNKDLNVVNYLDKIKLSIDKLMLVLQDLTNYSRNARLQAQEQLIDFDDVIAKSIAELHYLDKLKSIKIEKKLDLQFPFNSDLIRLKILLTNLLSNAIAHHDISKNEPFIEIMVVVNKENAIIKIKDNGKGIPEKFKDKIFDMFFKGSNDSQGSGLGLYIANGVIKKLKGVLEFESIEGEGSTFKITIPNGLI
jgi:signal transduction histidine kinase/Tfp pilus assembly protein PilF